MLARFVVAHGILHAMTKSEWRFKRIKKPLAASFHASKAFSISYKLLRALEAFDIFIAVFSLAKPLGPE